MPDTPSFGKFRASHLRMAFFYIKIGIDKSLAPVFCKIIMPMACAAIGTIMQKMANEKKGSRQARAQ